jgi:PHD/YefM family antitoxin component YafN of YafNO toxin-antitoxin module
VDDEKRVNETAAAYATLADQIVSEPIVLERNGKPAVVLMPYDEYQRLRRIERDAQARQEAAMSRQFHAKRNTLQKALGLLATSYSPPSDAEIEQWLDEHRTEKYG